ncbi:MAG: PqqD family protein [Acidobacteriota bacterium]
MISTVFATSPNVRDGWRATILEASWRQVAQPGELLRLAAISPGAEPRSQNARILLSRLPHAPFPGSHQDARPYLLPAAVLEWLSGDTQAPTTVLLCDRSSLFRAAVDDEVAAGHVMASPWQGLPKPGPGPFGLGEELDELRRVCAEPDLEVPAVTWPALIHSEDLLKLAPRWLELTGLLRANCREWAGWSRHSHRLAFAVALAEWELEVASRRLPVIRQDNTLMQPRRSGGVREARVLDHTILDIPGQEGTVNLNSSSSSIWDLVDGSRSVVEIALALERQFDKPEGALRDDVEVVLAGLVDVGALDVVQTSP